MRRIGGEKRRTIIVLIFKFQKCVDYYFTIFVLIHDYKFTVLSNFKNVNFFNELIKLIITPVGIHTILPNKIIKEILDD